MLKIFKLEKWKMCNYLETTSIGTKQKGGELVTPLHFHINAYGLYGFYELFKCKCQKICIIRIIRRKKVVSLQQN